MKFLLILIFLTRLSFGMNFPSQNATGSPSNDQGYLIRKQSYDLINGIIPSPLNLSEKIANGICDAQGIPRKKQVGLAKDFWVFDNGVANGSKKSFNLHSSSIHSHIWLENEITPNKEASSFLEGLLDEWERLIYPKVREKFGEDWPDGGIDGDPAINIILYPFDDDYLLGYFAPLNQFKNSELPDGLKKSNETEALYINWTMIIKNMNSRKNNIYATIAHEFQHLIHFYQGYLKHLIENGNYNGQPETVWFDEGCAELASRICGYGVPNSLAYFEKMPFMSLVNWEGYMENYGAAYSFVTYIDERLGASANEPNIIKKLVADGDIGFLAIKKFLPQGLTIHELMLDWATANLIDNNNICGGKFGYKYHDISIAKYITNLGDFTDYQRSFSDYPFQEIRMLAPWWGPGYIRFSKPFWPDYSMIGHFYFPSPDNFDAGNYEDANFNFSLRAVWFAEDTIEIVDIETVITGSATLTLANGSAINAQRHSISLSRPAGFFANYLYLIPLYTALNGEPLEELPSTVNILAINELLYTTSVGKPNCRLATMLNPAFPNELLLIADIESNVMNWAKLIDPDGEIISLDMKDSGISTRKIGRLSIDQMGEYIFSVNTTDLENLESTAIHRFFIADSCFYQGQMLSPPSFPLSITLPAADDDYRIIMEYESSDPIEINQESLKEKRGLVPVSQPIKITVSTNLPPKIQVIPQNKKNALFIKKDGEWKCAPFGSLNKDDIRNSIILMQDEKAPQISESELSQKRENIIRLYDNGSGLDISTLSMNKGFFRVISQSWDEIFLELEGEGDALVSISDHAGNITKESFNLSLAPKKGILRATAYPSPATDSVYFQVKSNGNAEKLSGIIYDSAGERVEFLRNNQWDHYNDSFTALWDIPNYVKNGIYFIIVKTDDRSTIKTTFSVLR